MLVPPPPTRMHEGGGRMRILIFLGKGLFLAVVLGRKLGKGGCFSSLFVIANGTQYPR